MIVHLNAWLVLSKFITKAMICWCEERKEERKWEEKDWSFKITSQYHPQLPTLTHQTTLKLPVSVPPTASDTDSPNNTQLTSLYHPQLPTLDSLNNTHITSLCTTHSSWHSSPLTDYLKLASNWISTSSQLHRVTPGQLYSQKVRKK